MSPNALARSALGLLLRPQSPAAAAKVATTSKASMSGLAQVVPDDPKFQQRLPDIIQPRFWDNQYPIDPDTFILDATNMQVFFF